MGKRSKSFNKENQKNEAENLLKESMESEDNDSDEPPKKSVLNISKYMN